MLEKHRLTSPLIAKPPRALGLISALLLALLLSNCAPRLDHGSHMVVSVREQKMLLVKDGRPVKTYPVSTSKFGLGSQVGSMKTPLGTHRVARKIGRGKPAGAVFKSRKYTGEILKPNAPGRDPIVSRILWLDGQQKHNRNSFKRYIYIHGTPEEKKLGEPSSYGCIRMASGDIIDLYRRIGVGAHVHVMRSSLPKLDAPEDSAKDRPQLAGKGTTPPAKPKARTARTKTSRDARTAKRLSHLRPGA